MRSNGNGRGPNPGRITYSEVRQWARWLDIFTASDLADVLRVDNSIGERMVRALLFHGICEDTGEVAGGFYGEEPIIQYIPIPHRTWNRDKHAPEWKLWPCYSEAPPDRGTPVRIRSGKKYGQVFAAGSGGGRHRMLLREQRFKAQEQAKKIRAEKQRERAQKALHPKQRSKRKGAPPSSSG